MFLFTVDCIAVVISSSFEWGTGACPCPKPGPRPVGVGGIPSPLSIRLDIILHK